MYLCYEEKITCLLISNYIVLCAMQVLTLHCKARNKIRVYF